MAGELTASALRALESTNTPHIVVYAVDTDDEGTIELPGFRTGLMASLRTDNTCFAFDFDPRDHGGATGADFTVPELDARICVKIVR